MAEPALFLPLGKVIRKRGSKYVLMTRDGSRRLGTHATRAEALAQERAVEAHKHMGKQVEQKVELVDPTTLNKFAKTADGTVYQIVDLVKGKLVKAEGEPGDEECHDEDGEVVGCDDPEAVDA